MALLIIDGASGVGKTTLMEEMDLAQYTVARCPRPELSEAWMLQQLEAAARSDAIALFDHCALFSYPVEKLTSKDERFHREYVISDEALAQAAEIVRNASPSLLILGVLPEEMLDEIQRVRQAAFVKVFEGWEHLTYDRTDAESVATVKDKLKEFIDAVSRPGNDRPQRGGDAGKSPRQR